MQAVNLKDAEHDLPNLMQQVLADAEPRIVINEAGEQVVLMRLDQFNSWHETMYLLSSPANAAHLRRGVDEVNGNLAVTRELSAE